MYTLVMLAALSPGADVTPAPVAAPVIVGAPAPVAYGCCGMSLGGCTGYAIPYGCSGYGCYGSCHGGLFHKHGGGLFGHKHSCSGCVGYACSGWSCFGSCYGYSCSGWSFGGGYGGGYGGYWGNGACFGFGTLQGTPFACHGGCYGGYYGGGSAWGPAVTMPPYSLHGYGYNHPIYGSPSVIYGTVTNVNQPPVITVPPGSSTPIDPKTGLPVDPKAGTGTGGTGGTGTGGTGTGGTGTDKDKDKTDKDKKGTGTGGMGANLKFRLPAEARLYVDGRLTTLTGSERVFTTPALAAGQKFYYDVKAVLGTGPEAVTEERRVVVEAGADLTESFPKLFAAGTTGGAVAGK